MIYFDSSALVKLVIKEKESMALASYVLERSATPQVSSLLVITEVRRTLHRMGVLDQAAQKADEVLDNLTLMPINRTVLEYASGLPDPHLRSLDAIHLATALRLRSSLTAMVTYDKRLAIAATESGAAVESPGTSTEHA